MSEQLEHIYKLTDVDLKFFTMLDLSTAYREMAHTMLDHVYAQGMRDGAKHVADTVRTHLRETKERVNAGTS